MFGDRGTLMLPLPASKGLIGSTAGRAETTAWSRSLDDALAPAVVGMASSSILDMIGSVYDMKHTVSKPSAHRHARFRTRFSSIVVTLTVLASSTILGCGTAAAQATGPDAATAGGTPIRITVGDAVLNGRLNATTMAQSLAKRLPMTVTFTSHPDGGDFPTKVTHLVPALATAGTTLGAAPGPGEIALYVPSGNLGLYYGQLSYWDGAVVLGSFTGDTRLIADQSGSFTVTIEAGQPR